MALTFILGGARSGKSELAQRLAAASDRPVVFVATMQPGDDELRSRVDAHRRERPSGWKTIEEPREVVGALAAVEPGSYVIIDCITLWVSNLLVARLGEAADASSASVDAALDDVRGRVESLLTWCAAHEGDVAVVSNEVGLGVVPAYPLGRIFRDALGSANAMLAAGADRTLHCTAGLVLDLKSLGARPVAESAPDARA